MPLECTLAGLQLAAHPPLRKWPSQHPAKAIPGDCREHDPGQRIGRAKHRAIGDPQPCDHRRCRNRKKEIRRQQQNAGQTRMQSGLAKPRARGVNDQKRFDPFTPDQEGHNDQNGQSQGNHPESRHPRGLILKFCPVIAYEIQLLRKFLDVSPDSRT